MDFDETPPSITTETLDWCDLHTPDFPLHRVTSAAAAFSDRQKFVGDLKQPAGFTSLQSSRPQGHIIWDRNRTGGSESSGTVEKTHFSWLLLSIKRRSFCHRPTTSQIKSEKSRFNREVLSEWPQSAACGPKLLLCLKKNLMLPHVPISGDVTKLRTEDWRSHKGPTLGRRASRQLPFPTPGRLLTNSSNHRKTQWDCSFAPCLPLYFDLQSKIPCFFSCSKAGNIFGAKTKTTL